MSENDLSAQLFYFHGSDRSTKINTLQSSSELYRPLNESINKLQNHRPTISKNRSLSSMITLGITLGNTRKNTPHHSQKCQQDHRRSFITFTKRTGVIFIHSHPSQSRGSIWPFRSPHIRHRYFFSLIIFAFNLTSYHKHHSPNSPNSTREPISIQAIFYRSHYSPYFQSDLSLRVKTYGWKPNRGNLRFDLFLKFRPKVRTKQNVSSPSSNDASS